MERVPGRDVGECPSTPSLFFFCLGFSSLGASAPDRIRKSRRERRDWSRLRLLLSFFI